MSRLVMVAFIAVALLSDIARAEDELEADPLTCRGLSVSLFERRFPDKVKRLTFKDTMLQTFVELWNSGSRPDLPKRPERVVIYALPGLPLIIGYQERHCLIAYLAVDSAELWRWLRPRLGWKV
jgi:hypothetical protein